jgi:hypothetical protein
MPHYQIIRDVGRTLLSVLNAEFTASKVKGKAHLATPTAEFLKKNAPSLVLYLYDLRPWVGNRSDEPFVEEEVVDDKGETHIVKFAQPLELDMRYMLCASGESLEEEWELLGLGIKAFGNTLKMDKKQLLGDSWFRDEELKIIEDGEFSLEKCHAIFGGFGAGPKVAVGYATSAKLFTGKELGRTRRVRQRQIDVFDPLRPPPGSVAARELGVEPRTPKIVSTKK